MAFTESEAKILAALTVHGGDRTTLEVSDTTGLSMRAVRTMLPRLAYEGLVLDRHLFGWRITDRGRSCVGVSVYKEIIAEIQSGTQ